MKEETLIAREENTKGNQQTFQYRNSLLELFGIITLPFVQMIVLKFPAVRKFTDLTKMFSWIILFHT